MSNQPQQKNEPAHTERKRIASWWLRFEDLNWPNPDAHERIKRRAEAMAKANATTAMIFGTHFRWDFLPYFTILHDYLATVAEELGKYGLELYDHHSVNLVHRYGTREEMRHVILHSGPHLPFSPSWEAAATWEYEGKRLNDWRMIDVKDRSVLWYPQYAAEGFCIRNPDFRSAYRSYLRRLIADTGIKGVSADDPVHYMHYHSCACPHCLSEFRRRTGMELPPVSDMGFWGNWENPAWCAWIDMRFDAASDFFSDITADLPKDFRVTTCGINSAAASANAMGSDARSFLSGINYVNLEMSGNTPPYKNDPVTVNVKVGNRLIGASHHQAAAREQGVRCFSTGFAFVEETANIVWAVNKMLDSDAWISTLKDRLGLPEAILKTLPNESDIVGRAFGFEHEHPELFCGKQVGQLGVYFSYETRKHSFFGSLDNGYYKDYHITLKQLFASGISPHTLFEFPKVPQDYPLIIVPSAAVMTEAECTAMNRYLQNGGKVVVTGPSAHPLCKNGWKLPTKPQLDDPLDFFSSIANGVWHKPPAWMSKTEILAPDAPKAWQRLADGLWYNPHRVSDREVSASLVDQVQRFVKPLPVRVLSSKGYLVTVFESDDAITVHLLAEDFDTDVDHALDDVRFHRSRVNFVNKVAAIGVTDVIEVAAPSLPSVYTPFEEDKSQATLENGVCKIRMPHHTSYAILHFQKPTPFPFPSQHC